MTFIVNAAVPKLPKTAQVVQSRELSAATLPSTKENKKKIFTCTVCARPFPGSHYGALLERTKQSVVSGADTVWRRHVIDPMRPCRACRNRQSQAKHKERVSKAQRERYDALLKQHNIEVPFDSLPKVTRLVRGTDPALDALSSLRRAAERETERLKPLALSIKAKIEEGQPLTPDEQYVVWLYSLHLTRKRIFAAARLERKHDQLNPVLTNDASRMHWRAYIALPDIHTLNEMAKQVNRYRPSTRGRPFKGLPDWRIPRADRGNGGANTRGEAVCSMAWDTLRKSIERTLNASKSSVRNRYRTRTNARKFRLTTDDSDLYATFTMEQFHMLRIDACNAALQHIEDAIIMQVHPLEWLPPWSDKKEDVHKWSQLVPPALRDELRRMHQAMPENMRVKLKLFPNYDNRTPFQIANNWTEMNTPMPKPAPARRATEERVSE